MFSGRPTGGPVASLKLVSPGAVTDGVTLLFLRKTDDLFPFFFSDRPAREIGRAHV